MISTPKLQTPNGILTPKFGSFPTTLPSRTSTMANGFDCANQNDDVDDVLMTPVLNTPKSIDIWPEKKLPEDNHNSPETPNDVELVIRELPRNLPMDSDIGLRSPCDGLLAKRRKQMREMNRRPGSLNPDSNSCDTPASENSPKDLSTGPPRSISDFHHFISNGTIRSHVPSSPRNLPGVLPPPLGDRRYEDFKRPANLQNLNAIKENDLPAHVNPSPLAVPSPNWSAVERFFGIEPIRTPKNIIVDNSYFDFIPPATPRSASRFKDRSPNPTMDCYSGRDQRLSPRLSPRFPIPEAPTDLSGRPPRTEKNGELHAPNEVQDLSTKSAKFCPSQNSSSEPTMSPPTQPTIILPPKQPALSPPSLQSVSLNPQVKSEFTQRIPSEIPKPGQSQKSVMSTYPSIQQQLSANELPVQRITVKTETIEGIQSQSDNYDFCHPPVHHLIPQSSASCYQNPFYLSSGFNHSYPRGLYNSHHDLEHPSPPQTISPPRTTFDRQGCQISSHGWNSTINPPHHTSLHHNLQHQHQSQSMSHCTSGGSLMISSTQPWNTQIKEEPPITPPPMTIIDSLALFQPTLKSLSKGKQGSNDLSIDKGKSQKKHNGETEEKRGRKKGKGKPKKEIGEGLSGENKRQYVCQYCQRSYDWNYNLNRHQKYECGKENAFQCAKCGRKFPHKQNCVYHLKRKHKVVYETIDQYMTAGLVTFRGASDNSGHSEAVPISQISSM